MVAAMALWTTKMMEAMEVMVMMVVVRMMMGMTTTKEKLHFKGVQSKLCNAYKKSTRCVLD